MARTRPAPSTDGQTVSRCTAPAQRANGSIPVPHRLTRPTFTGRRLRQEPESRPGGRRGPSVLPDHRGVIPMDRPHDVGVPWLQAAERERPEGAEVDHFVRHAGVPRASGPVERRQPCHAAAGRSEARRGGRRYFLTMVICPDTICQVPRRWSHTCVKRSSIGAAPASCGIVTRPVATAVTP